MPTAADAGASSVEFDTLPGFAPTGSVTPMHKPPAASALASATASSDEDGLRRATPDGTARYRERHARRFARDFYRAGPLGLALSSVGIGTYLGDDSDADDAAYTEAVRHAIASGVNVVDSAINYRCQRSERAIGKALRNSFAAGTVRRDEVVVCTKGGYIPLELSPPLTREGYRAFLDDEYFAADVMRPADVISGGHCLTPRYLDDQIQRSRRNLGLATIDVYYLHNPEQQLDVLPRPDFVEVLRDAFAALERQVDRGAISSYGCATWNGFRTQPGSRNHLNLEELVSVAREVAGAHHHFRVLQLPVNLAMMEAVRTPTQCVGNDRLSVLDAARRLGMSVVGSATLMQSQLTHSLPEEVCSTFPGFRTDARRAIAFSQSLPMVSSLVGMKSIAHLEENLAQSGVG
jgi:aryl-alcohol dehydrogenase-like predicted oxidoreductase